jgi:hypothetical protein
MRFLYTADYDYGYQFPCRELYGYDELQIEPLPGAEPPRRQKLY